MTQHAASESSDGAAKSLAAWQFFQQMLDNVTKIVTQDAESERELIEGLRVIARVSSLCAQMSVESDLAQPVFFDMCSPNRMIGGPNPDGNYYLAMIRGDRRYRITGTRGTSAYLGLQILAGTGLTPRRMAGYISDSDLALDSGEFALVLSAQEPDDLAGAQWLQIPEDASAVVVREYIADRAAEELATLHIDALDPESVNTLTDADLADQFTAMAWSLMKLTTMHRTIKPELLQSPNTLLTAEAADLGAADTTPDNLYMIGTFRLEPGQVLVLDIAPPDTRYWNVTLESIWHECLEPRRRHSSVTNRGVQPDDDGRVRIAISAEDYGLGHWLDTGGRHRGFVVLRWLDNPSPPDVTVSVRKGADGRKEAE
ncbi:hypothetical protein BST27_01990 [Mycobacterium intermedium]|uniref:DUF1214 domain-containing protein n=1 Tax=Mycobacterium intermedium TaxID=28445 RepID=A0A1E3SKM2_MYCIE|nr:DUF1214 domain-containing protein [Mycobacterium intermedium]ODR02695.1 hypothetical protein BHQ20_04140 [Mycobacterium intermedium]OPE47262.1 hypothetical protein BV508_22645 [Mycobacterium intermedium]ORB10365.1 hypothetical protein BST27_01990 [Mycobacterium intermedium]